MSLSDIVETQPERLATGFVFTEGPLWHPDGFFYFTEILSWRATGDRPVLDLPSRLHRVALGGEPVLVRDCPEGANGTTFDLDGNLIVCEPDARGVARIRADGSREVIAGTYDGKRLNLPNDIICRSDGSIYFTDPNLRVPLEKRELADSHVFRLDPDGRLTSIANCEYPNGLAFSPDERILYVANTRWTPYLLAFTLDEAGNVTRRRIFADMSSEAEGVPDGLKVDAAGRVYCTGPGGVWVFEPDGTKLGVISVPEVPANLAFGGPDLRTVLITARTSVYTMRVMTPGQPHPRYLRR
jgi:gluconolactonase